MPSPTKAEIATRVRQWRDELERELACVGAVETRLRSASSPRCARCCET
jgi:hypothetical protein